MPSKHGSAAGGSGSGSTRAAGGRPRRNPSTSSSDGRRKTRRQGSKVESSTARTRDRGERDARRRRARSSSTDCKRRRPPSNSSSESSRDRKKFRPKKSKSPDSKSVKPASDKTARLPFSDSGNRPPGSTAASMSSVLGVPHASCKAGAKSPSAGNGAKASPGASPPASPPAEGAVAAEKPKPKLDFGNLGELQKKLEEAKAGLELFIIKAKREHDEKKESKEKLEAREKEYYHAELGMPCGPSNRFLLDAHLGTGVFSTVYRGKDMGHQGKDFAIKFIRKDPMCRRATEKEVKLMRRLRNQASEQDPEGARCLLGLAGMEMFEHEGHLAVVLQLMKCDLRNGLRRYGLGYGLPLAFVHTFARDIFLALRALRGIKIVHTDLKPDNLLISLDRTSVKLSDFGSAMDTTQATQVHTDYLQPRFYRAPEVIMGQPYTTQIDMWSAGVTLFELATDRTLFRGDSNNGMIHAMLKVCGPFSKTSATTGKCASKHFNENGDFLLKDKGNPDAQGNPAVETVVMSSFEKPKQSLLEMLEEAEDKKAQMTTEGMANADAIAHAKADAKAKASIKQLADLLAKCCKLDPGERCTPKQALAHAFVQKVGGVIP